MIQGIGEGRGFGERKRKEESEETAEKEQGNRSSCIKLSIFLYIPTSKKMYSSKMVWQNFINFDRWKLE